MKNEGLLKVATCQFAVNGSVKQNARQIREFINKAGKAGADVVHFCETALTGYAGIDFKTFNGFDWQLLVEETEKIMALAGKLGLWVVLGSAHRLTGPNKPHNCVYLINPQGKIADRYDKRFCTPNDFLHYTPGNRFANFTINGVKCSMLICFDARFPELYRQLCKQSVNCIFQSFYNAHHKGPSVHTHIIRQTMQCHAATNSFWVSLANSSGRYSPWPSCFIQPDGIIVSQFKFHRSGMIANTVDIRKPFYDPSEPYRKMAIEGILTNGSKTIKDPRSRNTTIL